ncbi:MAG: GNAT family N-acetyltransferase [Dehalococcoidia bacterium]|nr:GNAT family N-acetyltransferase [Dehalococcoidia bacterium]
MTSTLPATVQAEEQRRVLAPLVTAFASDPVVRWVFPDPDEYLRHFPEFAWHLGGAAFDCGTADHAEDFAASALWLPPGIHSDEAALVALFERSVPADRQPAVFEVLGQLDADHPADPFWYLPLIGVDPQLQGRGYGSALLARALERVDAEHLPAYLESSNERNVPLYERHGFEVAGQTEVAGAPSLWPMVRQAR